MLSSTSTPFDVVTSTCRLTQHWNLTFHNKTYLLSITWCALQLNQWASATTLPPVSVTGRTQANVALLTFVRINWRVDDSLVACALYDKILAYRVVRWRLVVCYGDEQNRLKCYKFILFAEKTDNWRTVFIIYVTWLSSFSYVFVWLYGLMSVWTWHKYSRDNVGWRNLLKLFINQGIECVE